MNLRRNRKGSLIDVVFLMTGLLMIGMIMLVSYKIYDSYNSQVQSMDSIPAEAKAVSAGLDRAYSSTLDNAVLFATVVTIMAIFALATLVRVHPVFLPLYFLGMIVLIFICGAFSNIYQEMAANAQLTALADKLLFTSYILNYLPLIVGVIGTVLAIVMYKSYAGAQ